MNIELHDGNWFINGYFITGCDEDYRVFVDNDGDENTPLFASSNFEECLTWCYNS